MRLEVAGETHTGLRKKNNEDYYGIYGENTPGLQLVKEGYMLCVADGLGGHAGGEIASKLAVTYVRDALKKAPPEPADGVTEDEAIVSVIRESFLQANQSIYQTNTDLVQGKRPMGTTLLAALVTPRKAYVVNVGDSRCYHFRAGEIIAHTEDHSWVDEQVKLGLMSKAEAESDSRRNLVTRSIGTQEVVEPDDYVWHIVPGDMLLLCTDGLINMVNDGDILDEFRRWASPAEISHRLVEMANANGGKDNITVITATVSPSPVRLWQLRALSLWRRRKVHIIWLAVCLLFGTLTFLAGNFLGLFVP